jgi:hypothetical protein
VVACGDQAFPSPGLKAPVYKPTGGITMVQAEWGLNPETG